MKGVAELTGNDRNSASPFFNVPSVSLSSFLSSHHPSVSLSVFYRQLFLFPFSNVIIYGLDRGFVNVYLRRTISCIIQRLTRQSVLRHIYQSLLVVFILCVYLSTSSAAVVPARMHGNC